MPFPNACVVFSAGVTSTALDTSGERVGAETAFKNTKSKYLGRELERKG